MRRGAAILLALLIVACGDSGTTLTPVKRKPVRPNLGSLLDRARRLESTGDLEGAAAAFREILTVEPEHAAALYQLAWVLRRLGDTNQAIGLLDRLKEVDGIPNRARMLKAAILTDPERLRKGPVAAAAALAMAESEYRAAIPTNPEDSATHAGLGRTLLLQERLEEARVELLRALGLNPRDEDSVLWLAAALWRSEEKEAARGALRGFLAELGPIERPDVPEEGDTAAGSALRGSAGSRARRLLALLETSLERLPVPENPTGRPSDRGDPLHLSLPLFAETLLGGSSAYLQDVDGDGKAELVIRGKGLLSAETIVARYVEL